jgi:hypothetical protein
MERAGGAGMCLALSRRAGRRATADRARVSVAEGGDDYAPFRLVPLALPADTGTLRWPDEFRWSYDRDGLRAGAIVGRDWVRSDGDSGDARGIVAGARTAPASAPGGCLDTPRHAQPAHRHHSWVGEPTAAAGHA